ncbi:MAG: ABC transporter ATP-binding protein [Lachnospiraceae bacterium]|nr:ABC transporter ATP-binding protein [Lachnospiraceae bacterium]
MIKKLSVYVGEFKKEALLSPICIAIEVIMEVILPVLMAAVIDNGVNVGDMNYVVKMGLLMIVVAFISLTGGALCGKYAAIASSGFARNLRKAMFTKIQDFSFANIDKFSTAGLVTRMTTDVTNVQQSFQMIIRICVRSPFMLIFSLIMCLRLAPQVSWIFLVALVFLGGVLAFISSRAFPKFRKMFEQYDKLNANVQENLAGIRVVKAYVREKHETEKFLAQSGKVKDLSIAAEKLIILNSPAMQLTMYGCILVISWLGAGSIVAGNMTTGTLMSLFTYTMQVLMSLMMISMIFVMLTMSKTSAERIMEVLDEESTIKNPENPVMEVADGSIDFENVAFRYSGGADKNVLENVNIHIKSGETIGIIGGTGSSKSTFVQLIPRLYDVSEGIVKVGGVDVRDYDMEVLRNEVSMVLQKNVLFSGTILENLRWGNENATLEEAKHACELAQAAEFIERFPDGYETKIERGGTNVSGGQKQRLCIARALLKKPKILILDDSTSAVDTATDAKIRKAFREEIPNTTKLIIAQRISSVEDADHIIVLNEGKINGYGTHEELLANNEIYRDIYELQQKGAEE